MACLLVSQQNIAQSAALLFRLPLVHHGTVTSPRESTHTSPAVHKR